MRRWPTGLGALLALVVAMVARGDVVEMTDGRRFEGEIVGQDAEAVRIDARVTPTIRAVLTLPRAEIASLERKPLPPGFFDPPPKPAAPRESSEAAHDDGANLYLEVPIVGRLGEAVFADYLVRNRDRFQ